MATKKKAKQPSLKVGQVWRTRNGLRARVLARLRDAKGTPAYDKTRFPFLVVIYDFENGDQYETYGRNGSRFNDTHEDDLDLVKFTRFDRIL